MPFIQCQKRKTTEIDGRIQENEIEFEEKIRKHALKIVDYFKKRLGLKKNGIQKVGAKRVKVL